MKIKPNVSLEINNLINSLMDLLFKAVFTDKYIRYALSCEWKLSW